MAKIKANPRSACTLLNGNRDASGRGAFGRGGFGGLVST